MRPMMQRPMMYGAHAALWHGIVVLLVVAVLVAGAIVIVRMLANRPAPPGVVPAPPAQDAPLRILEERFARGEIDEAEFRSRRDVLRS